MCFFELKHTHCDTKKFYQKKSHYCLFLFHLHLFIFVLCLFFAFFCFFLFSGFVCTTVVCQTIDCYSMLQLFYCIPNAGACNFFFFGLLFVSFVSPVILLLLLLIYCYQQYYACMYDFFRSYFYYQFPQKTNRNDVLPIFHSFYFINFIPFCSPSHGFYFIHPFLPI